MDESREWERSAHHDAAAVVFKLIRDPLQHGGLAVSRSLGRLGVAVHEASRVRGTPAARSRYVRSHVLLPDGGEHADQVMERLVSLAARVGERPLLVPTDDVAALFVADHPQLAQHVRLPAQPQGLAHRLSDKRLLHQLCLEAGVPTPDARFPTSRDAWRAAAEALGFPVVVKSMDPVLLRRRPRAASVAIARDVDEVLALYDAMEDPAEPNLMLQEFVPGGPETVWMFNGYFDRTGACPIGIVGKKIRQAPPRTGATTLGVVVENDEVSRSAREFLQGIGYRGIVDMGFRFDARDGRYKLLDVNPRIGSSFRLFVGGNGMDVARALYLDLTEQSVPATSATVGRRWWVEDQDAATCLKLMRAGELGLRELLSSFRGVRESAWLARDDLRPALALSGAVAGHLLSRVWSRRDVRQPADGDADGRSVGPS
jgi:D-aspartate ligase